MLIKLIDYTEYALPKVSIQRGTRTGSHDIKVISMVLAFFLNYEGNFVDFFS